MHTIISIVAGILIAVVSSWITVQLSLIKFQKEKLWEKKLESYSNIIESLHNLKEYLSSEESFETGERDREHVSKEFLDRLVGKYISSNEAVKKYKDIGELILPSEAILLLEKYYKEIKVERESYYEHVDETLHATNLCLKEMISFAKTDLNKYRKGSFLSFSK